jgi:hypothetical protein
MFRVIVKTFIGGQFKEDDPDPQTQNDMGKYRYVIFWFRIIVEMLFQNNRCKYFGY